MKMALFESQLKTVLNGIKLPRHFAEGVYGMGVWGLKMPRQCTLLMHSTATDFHQFHTHWPAVPPCRDSPYLSCCLP
jgi:hypothetical protein